MKRIHLKGKTEYIPGPTNIGLYFINDQDVWLIDCGGNSAIGKELLSLLEKEHLHLIGIVATHAHADHVGAAAFIIEHTGCPVYLAPMACAMVNYPITQPAFFYGGYPLKQTCGPYLLADPFVGIPNTECIVRDLFEWIPLPGHSFDEYGIQTPDGVLFAGDALFGTKLLDRFHMMFLYDLTSFKQSLEVLRHIQADFVVPSHGDPTLKEDVPLLCDRNKREVEQIEEHILSYLKEPHTEEHTLAYLMGQLDRVLSEEQYVICGCTLRSYLSCMERENKIQTMMNENYLLYKTREGLEDEKN